MHKSVEKKGKSLMGRTKIIWKKIVLDFLNYLLYSLNTIVACNKNAKRDEKTVRNGRKCTAMPE